MSFLRGIRAINSWTYFCRSQERLMKSFVPKPVKPTVIPAGYRYEPVECEVCNGVGAVDYKERKVSKWDGFVSYKTHRVQCTLCKGLGHVIVKHKVTAGNK